MADKPGPPVVHLYPFLGEGSPTQIDYRKKGTLLLTSLLEDLVKITPPKKSTKKAELQLGGKTLQAA